MQSTVTTQHTPKKLLKMKIFVVLATVLAVAIAADTYDPKYDNFNVHELIENSVLLKNYGKCFLGTGPCTAEGKDFKKIIPEALRTTCAKCTPKQREHIRLVVRAFQTQLPEVWEELVNKEDPKREFVKSFEEFLKGSD